MKIYFGRKSNELVNAGLTYDGCVSVEVALKHEKKRESWRENAQKASDRLDNRIKKSHERKNSYKIYEKGDKVFAKCEKRRGRKSVRHKILVGSILKRYKDNTNYDIKMEEQQFSSVVFALRDLHIFRSAETLRNEVVSYLNTQFYSSDGIPLELFAGILWS